LKRFSVYWGPSRQSKTEHALAELRYYERPGGHIENARIDKRI
jgi:hypothetical protein